MQRVPRLIDDDARPKQSLRGALGPPARRRKGPGRGKCPWRSARRPAPKSPDVELTFARCCGGGLGPGPSDPSRLWLCLSPSRGAAGLRRPGKQPSPRDPRQSLGALDSSYELLAPQAGTLFRLGSSPRALSPLRAGGPHRLSARVLAAGPVQPVYSLSSQAGQVAFQRPERINARLRGFARALRPRTRGRRAGESHGSRATFLPGPDRQAARLSCA
jgi:hypothetical protein